MAYRYTVATNREAFASGRVIYPAHGLATFPVRLAQELFLRALSHLPDQTDISIYDPLCGQGYLLTVLGLSFGEKINSIYASDIDPKSLQKARQNLALLTPQGLEARITELQTLASAHQKSAHQLALEDARAFLEKQSPIGIQVFQADALEGGPNWPVGSVDLILTDLPYGQLVGWHSAVENAPQQFLERIKSHLEPHSILGISSDKAQKVSHPDYQRLEKFQIGKRRIVLLRKSA